MEGKNEIGHLTVAADTPQERQVLITNRAAFNFVDDRLVSVCKLDKEYGFYVEIASSPESDRTNQQMWLSKDSLIALQAALNLYSVASNWDVEEQVNKAIGNENFDYLIQGDDLKDPFEETKKTTGDNQGLSDTDLEIIHENI